MWCERTHTSHRANLPLAGGYTHGLFLEGARMTEELKLGESQPKVRRALLSHRACAPSLASPSRATPPHVQLARAQVLFAPMVCVLLKPKPQDQLDDYPHYECPVYRTTARRGTLSTTGHSTNFVMFIRLPSDADKAHWITRGVALLCSLNS